MTNIEGSASIRSMIENDLPEVRILADQLGYPLSIENLRERFSFVSRQDDHALFVACLTDGRVIGWIHVGREMSSLLTQERADIGALIVDSEYRSRGAGAMLMAAAEKWAESRNLNLVRVRSNVKRSDAHRFYQRSGYKLVKSWHLFTKDLDEVSHA